MLQQGQRIDQIGCNHNKSLFKRVLKVALNYIKLEEWDLHIIIGYQLDPWENSWRIDLLVI